MKNVNVAKSIITSLFAVAVTSAAWAGLDRTLTVSDPDANGNVTITFGEGGVAESGQALIAAWAPADRGDDVMDWTEFRYVGKLKVLPTDKSRDFTIPETWRTRSGCVRFFLMERHLPFPTYIAYATRPDVPEGGLYINTGVYPDSTVDVTVRFSSPDLSGNPSMCPFGISGLLYLFPKSKTEYYFDFFGAKASAKTSGVLDASYVNVFNEAAPHGSDEMIEVRLNRDGVYMNGHRHMAFDPSTVTGGTSGSPISLFGRFGSWKQVGTTCSIASAKIWMNGELVRDLIPCQITSGEVRMYDRKNSKFYEKVNGKKSDGTFISEASFTAGPEIDPVPSDAGAPVSRSRTLVFAPTLTVVSNDKQKGTVVAISEGHDAGLLLAVASKTDAGETYSDWTESLTVAKVAANENTVTVDLPRAWWRSHYRVRFVWKSIAGLPYDRELTYLHSDGGDCAYARVQTGWRPTVDTRIEVESRTAVNVCPFGITGYSYLFLNGDNKLYGGFGDQKSAEGVPVADPTAFTREFHTWKLNKVGGYVDGDPVVEFSTTPTMATATKGISVPFRVSTGGDVDTGKVGDVEVKGAKFWDGDFLGLDLVPCEKDGVVGFYDRVRGTFNNGKMGGAFTAGETVVADGDALAWSQGVGLVCGLVVVVQ